MCRIIQLGISNFFSFGGYMNWSIYCMVIRMIALDSCIYNGFGWFYDHLRFMHMQGTWMDPPFPMPVSPISQYSRKYQIYYNEKIDNPKNIIHDSRGI